MLTRTSSLSLLCCFSSPGLRTQPARDENLVEDNRAAIPDQNAIGDEEDDEASVLALREQLLKSMVSKRAARSADKTNERSNEASTTSNNSRAASPYPIDVPRVASPGVGRPEKTPAKGGPPPKVSITNKTKWLPPLLSFSGGHFIP